MTPDFQIHFAPLQGYTDWIYRNAFNKFFKGVTCYYTPFVRILPHNKFRNKDLRDINPENNHISCLIPQILPGNKEEFSSLVDNVTSYGYKKIDINMGCPFPMIGKKKGAGILPYPDEVKSLLETIEEYPDIDFSVKMRLGWDNPCECMSLIPIFNTLRLSHITLHARIGIQKYKGEPDLEAFRAFYEECHIPLYYNGDLTHKEEIQKIKEEFKLLRGVCIGRGLLSSPFLAEKFYNIQSENNRTKKERIMDFHDELFISYKNYLMNEKQTLDKMKIFWEYLLMDRDKKSYKQIKKSQNLNKYLAVVENLSEEIFEQL